MRGFAATTKIEISREINALVFDEELDHFGSSLIEKKRIRHEFQEKEKGCWAHHVFADGRVDSLV